MKRICLMLLMFALLLPACALAVVEGVVEEAPSVNMSIAAPQAE